MGESAYSNADSKDAAIYAADLRRIVNGWRITQHRRTKRADRAPVTPTYDDPVNDGLVRCAWVLVHTYAGAHHVPSVRVGSGGWLEVIEPGNLATADGFVLTLLVIAAHEAAVRVEISACGPRAARLMLHPRGRGGGVSVDHPILDTTLTELRQRWAPCPVAVPGGSEHCPATRPYDPDEDYGDELDEEGLDADDFESPEEVEERRAAGECVCDGLLSIPCPRCDGLGPRDGEL